MQTKLFERGYYKHFKHVKLDNDIEAKKIQSNRIELNCEMAGITILIDKNGMLFEVFGINRSQLDNAFTLMANVLSEIPNKNCGLCILGAVNVSGLVQSKESTSVCELLSSFNTARNMMPPTRITATSAISIGIVCTDFELDRVNVEMLQTGPKRELHF